MNEFARPRAQSGHPTPDGRILVHMGGPISGNNWHFPEQLPHGGAYRWSGPGEKATLNIQVRRDREMLVVIDYFMPLIEDQMAGLRIQVDGIEVPHSVHSDTHPECIVAQLPARDISTGGHTELAIVLTYTASPDSNRDPRKLGLAVHSISVVPAEPALPAQFPISRYETFRRRMGLSPRPHHFSNFPLSHFDGLAYLEDYPDVADAVIAGTMPSALEHYRRHGSKDGRRFILAIARVPNEGSAADIFDGVAYLEMYPDVADVVRSEIEPSAFEHFLKYGRRDGRKIPTRFDGQARRGKALELVRLDAIRQARTDMETLKVLLMRENAVHTNQLSARLSTIESAIPGVALWSELEADRAERETRERELWGDIAALRASSANIQQALEAEVATLDEKLTLAQQQLTSVVRSDELTRTQHEALQNKVHKEIVAALNQRQSLLEQLESFKSSVAELEVRLSATAQTHENVRTDIAGILASEQTLLQQVGFIKSELLEAQKRVAVAARADELEQLQKELAAQISAVKSIATKAHDDISAAARTADLEQLKREATHEIERIREEIAAAAAIRQARDQSLSTQVDAVRSVVAKAQEEISASARSADLEHLKREATREIERIREEIAAAAAIRQAREQSLSTQVDAVRSVVAKAQEEISASARSSDLEHLKREATREIERIREEIAAAAAIRQAREQSLSVQVDAVRSVVAKVQEEISATARSSDLEHLKREATRELERVRGEIASALTMRELREQAVLEQIDLLRISLDESHRKLSATALAEDLNRLRRDAAQDLERARREVASISAVENAREQTLFAQIDTLKAEINSAKSRAELAEVKVASVQRELEADTREINESIQRSTALLDGLRNEVAGTNSLRDSTETVIKTELELLKHEFSVAQMAALAAPTSSSGKGRDSGKSFSQLGQDLWVLQKTEFKKGGYFVDIGATDGVLLNNTYLLENQYDWKGICVEPDPAAYQTLSKNRKVRCSGACLWSVSGQVLDFILAKEYGGISNTSGLDAHANKRRAYSNIGQSIEVRTTTLNDLLEEAKAPGAIDYISLDTEGSEYEILSAFDFDRWQVRLWTIEHNFTEQRARIYDLMSARGYKRREVEWDDWYFR